MMPPMTIASVVEGHGEVSALPVLARRIASEVFGVYDLVLSPPHRVKRSQMTRTDLLNRAVKLQSIRIAGSGGVLVVADADDDCALTLAATLRDQCKPVPVEVAIAVREFEAWFLAGAESLRGHRAIDPSAAFEGDPEVPRGAKGVLASLMTESYKETIHQPAFAARLSLEQARRARSFAHLVTCVGRLTGSTS